MVKLRRTSPSSAFEKSGRWGTASGWQRWALALANSRDGFLLIDEAENGIHHSLQPDFWHMVFKTAHANNVQVIATTHSFDCVRGFAQAAVECEEVEGYTSCAIERKDKEMWAVEYSERNLKVAAKQQY